MPLLLCSPSRFLCLNPLSQPCPGNMCSGGCVLWVDKLLLRPALFVRCLELRGGDPGPGWRLRGRVVAVSCKQAAAWGHLQRGRRGCPPFPSTPRIPLCSSITAHKPLRLCGLRSSLGRGLLFFLFFSISLEINWSDQQWLCQVLAPSALSL